MRFVYLIIGIILGLLFSMLFCGCNKSNADYEYFKIVEFKCNNNQEAIWVAQNILIPELTKIRIKRNTKMIITNGYNTGKGQVDSSDHRYRKKPMRAGVDVAIYNGYERYTLLKWCYYYDVPRLGIANSFIHIGFTKINAPQNVVWLYNNNDL